MIVINDVIFESLEQIEVFAQAVKNDSYKEEHKIAADFYKDYLLECFDADIKLQELVSNNLSEDYISFVILPVDFYEDLSSFSFELASLTGQKIKKRDEIRYNGYCDACFKDIVPFFNRVIDFYS